MLSHNSVTRQRSLLIIARVVWLVLVALMATGLAANVPFTFAWLRTVCHAAECYGQLQPADHDLLLRYGLSASAYATYTIILHLALLLVCWLVAAVIFWRKPRDWTALFISFVLVTLSVGFFNLDTFTPGWHPFFYILAFLDYILFVTLFFIFPDGQFVPRWTSVVALVWNGFILIWPLVLWLTGVLPGLFWDITPVLLLSVLGTGVFAQLYRYKYLASPVQRQQTKWVVAGFVVLVLINGGLGIYLTFLRPALGHPWPSGVLYEVADTTLTFFSLVLIPLTLGMAILRYRLWDIDLIINRALVYTMLTASLALVYFGSVLLLQQLFQAITSGAATQQSELEIVVSTLVIAALFRPLRQRIQAVIDQRFYRRRYNAAKTLASFSATARDEVDLETLRAELLRVVEKTMQPTHVALWLKPMARHREL
jgi:hypothetical protein